VIVPSKETVYPDFLPWSATRARSTTRFDEMLSLLNSAGVAYLDLRPLLLEGRRSAQIYDSVDSHWNGRGALLGTRAILDRTGTILKQPQSFFEPNAHLTHRDSEADLLLILSLDDRVKVPSVALVPNRKRAVRLEPPESVLKTTRKQHNKMVFEVPDESLPKALILRDSFAEMLMPTVVEKFRRSVWVWTHELDLRLVDRERPDIVIVETTERFLYDKPPRLLTRRR
jgi:hypothetical protein